MDSDQATGDGLGNPRTTGVGFSPSTGEGIVIAGGLALGGGLLGYWLGGKKHRALGAGIGAVSGLVVVPLIGSMIGFSK